MLRLRWISLVAVTVACGSVKSKSDAPVCTPETDGEFCMRIAKNCDSVTAVDNCGQSRTASCGTCTTAAPICSANVCVAPACGTSFTAGAGTAVAGVNIAGKQSALLGASASGGSVLYLEATGTCVTQGSTLEIADGPPYVPQDISGLANLAAFARAEETMTLTADGLTVIGVGTDGRSVLGSSRSGLGQTDFSAASTASFQALNAVLPPSPANVSWPLLSADGLSLTFRVSNATDPNANGIYETVRASPAAAFPAAAKLPGAIQGFESISGISADRLTAFVTMSFGTQILTRTSLSDPFAVPTMSTPPGNAFRVVPIAGCNTLIGTCEPGGCSNEAICTWAKN